MIFILSSITLQIGLTLSIFKVPIFFTSHLMLGQVQPHLMFKQSSQQSTTHLVRMPTQRIILVMYSTV